MKNQLSDLVGNFQEPTNELDAELYGNLYVANEGGWDVVSYKGEGLDFVTTLPIGARVVENNHFGWN
jgi:hypothetical protein